MKNRNNSLKPWCSATLLACAAAAILLFPTDEAAALAQTSPVATATQGETISRPNFDWISDKWTGDDRPFAAARLTVDRLFQSGVDVEPYIKSYAKVAEMNPTNAIDQFQWAYAWGKQNEIPHSEARDNLPALAALARADQPHCFEYSRLRLVIGDFTADERPLIERLLGRDPNDPYVGEAYAYVLSISKSKLDNNQAIQKDSQIAGSGEDRPSIYLLLGFVYANVGFLQHDMSDYTKAIAVENEFLSLTPAYDWRCLVARHCIQVLQSRLQAQL